MSGKTDPRRLATDQNLLQVSDESEIGAIVDQILADPASANSINDIKAGKDKAIGYGIPGVRADGNDVVDTYQVTKEAVDRALAHRVGHRWRDCRLTPVAIREAVAFHETVYRQNPQQFDYEAVATAVFSQPPVGVVGLSESEARHSCPGEVDVYVTRFRPMKYAFTGSDDVSLAEGVVAGVFVLAAILSWWPGLLYLAGWSPMPIAGFGPFLAAVVVLARPDEIRTKELHAAREILGYDQVMFLDLPDGSVGQDMRALVGGLDVVLNSCRPDELYLPYPSMHQDHIAVYEAGIRAGRLSMTDGHWFTPSLYVYDVAAYGVDEQTHRIDMDHVRERALASRSSGISPVARYIRAKSPSRRAG